MTQNLKILTDDKNAINPVHTSCGDCIFANYNQDNLQVGCVDNRIEKFKANGLEILEATDNERDFYIINGQKCNLKRTAKWARNANKDITKNDLLQVAKEQNKIKFYLMLYIDNQHTIQNVKNMVANLLKNTYDGVKYTFVLNTNNILAAEVKSILKATNLQNWRIETIYEKELPTNFKGTKRDRAIDIAMKKVDKHQFTGVYDIDKSFHLQIFEKIDQLFNQHLQNILVVESGQGYFFYTSMYYFMGTLFSDMLSRIKESVQKTNENHLVKMYHELI